MRAFATLMLMTGLFTSLLACSESTLSTIPKLDTAEDTGLAPIPDLEPIAEPTEPIADAGPDRLFATGATVELDGSASYDPEGNEPLVYAWAFLTMPVGSAAVIDVPAAEQPTFRADLPGEYVVELNVQNSIGLWDSTPAEVRITTEDEPVLEPVANAGPDQVVDEGRTVQLDGTASFDPQGLVPLQYNWQLSQRPAGSLAMISDTASATPTFDADVEGEYVIELAVMNSANVMDSTADTVVVIANPVILEPVSDAGIDISETVGMAVVLDGSFSFDPQGLEPLDYYWEIVSRPPGATAQLNNPAVHNPGLYPDIAGEWIIDLVVGNTAGVWDSTPDTIILNVTEAPVLEPIADAGADESVSPLMNVTLDGSASYDPAGSPLTYQWTPVSKPAGSTASLAYTNTAQPEFFADLAGEYIFELTVMNADGVWDTTPDQVVIEALPLDGFYVEVSWDNTNDLDLHILQGGSALWSPGDANFCNMTPSWGGAGTLDDPSLDWDAIYGFGPETTTIDEPASGTYQIAVHYYGMDGFSDCGLFSSCPSTVATVNVYLGGALAATFQRPMDDQGDLWEVAEISWPSGQITTVDNMNQANGTYCN